MQSLTVSDNGAALVKKLRYFRANVNETGLIISIAISVSGLSELPLALSLTFPAKITHIHKEYGESTSHAKISLRKPDVR